MRLEFRLASLLPSSLLRSAAGLARLLGRAGIELLTRVVGVLLAAIAVQLVAGGVQNRVLHCVL